MHIRLSAALLLALSAFPGSSAEPQTAAPAGVPATVSPALDAPDLLGPAADEGGAPARALDPFHPGNWAVQLVVGAQWSTQLGPGAAPGHEVPGGFVSGRNY